MASKMAVIYKISCKDLNVKQCYFGSTKYFNTRKKQHKNNCYNEKRKHYNIPLYKFIRNNNGWDNFEMKIIDCITSDDKEIYQKCEAKYIRDNIDIVLNKIIPGRSDKEYYEDNKEKNMEKDKIYRENNKEKINEYGKVYREENKEKEILRHKIYHQNNKEKIIERKKVYKKQKVTCPICLKSITRGSLYKHKQSLTCQLNKCIIID